MGLFLRKTASIHNCYINYNAIFDWLMCKTPWLIVTWLTLLHKGIEETTSWHEFWFSLARQIQKRSYLTDRQSFKRFYTENGASSKKGKRKQQSSVSTKPTLVDMEKSHRSAVQWNKHCKPPPEPGRIHLEYGVRRYKRPTKGCEKVTLKELSSTCLFSFPFLEDSRKIIR